MTKSILAATSNPPRRIRSSGHGRLTAPEDICDTPFVPRPAEVVEVFEDIDGEPFEDDLIDLTEGTISAPPARYPVLDQFVLPQLRSKDPYQLIEQILAYIKQMLLTRPNFTLLGRTHDLHQIDYHPEVSHAASITARLQDLTSAAS